jgi:outer membrane immunogenic protein
MKRVLTTIAGALALAVASQPVSSADIPTKAPAYKARVAAPIFDWSGFYVGGHAGWVRFRDRFDVDVGFSETLKGDGFIGGVLAGYNWQYAPNWVFSIEADGGWTSAKSGVDPAVAGPGDLQAKMNWDAHLRARLGYAMDRTLLFIAGGAAWANFSQPTIFFGAPKETHTGWTIGGGVDHAVTQNLLLRAEYLFADYGRKTYDYSAAGGGTIDGRFRTHTIRAAAIYRFATGKAPAPVVSRY